jgi:hypothetical protein
MNLELEIEELVLYGFAGMDKDRISRALHLELERLFAEEGVPASVQAGGDVARLDGGSFQAAKEASAEQVGVQVARAIYGGMRR